MTQPLLSVRDLTLSLATSDGPHRVLDSLSFDVEAGARVGMGGANGAGKSLVALTLMNLLPDAAKPSGSVRFAGQEVLGDEAALMRLRGSSIAIVFQEARAAFDPFRRIGKQIIDAVAQSRKLRRREARARADLAMERTGIRDATSRGDAYPDELSRGVLQEALVAMAIAVEPTLLIADDPVSALDGIERQRIIELLVTSTRERGAALLFMSRDPRALSAASELIYVLAAGRSIESGDTGEVLRAPQHPLTRTWLGMRPSEPAPELQSEAQPRPEAS